MPDIAPLTWSRLLTCLLCGFLIGIERQLRGKPVGIVSAAAGISGGMRAQYHLRQVCVFLDLHPLNKPEVFANAFAGAFDADGNLLHAHHYLTRVRKLPVPVDEPVAIDIDLVPTDAVIDAGHRLRVDVYAASFPRFLTLVPDLIKARSRKQRLVLDPEHPSYLTFQAIGSFPSA